MSLQKLLSALGNFRNDRLVVWSLAIIILLRILFTGVMGLMPQDAYYFFYSQHLALSYFDHPPGIAYMLRLFTSIFGEHVFVIKFADLFVTAISTIAFYKLTRLFVNNEKQGNALVLLLSTFMVTILSLVSTPDVPLMLCWTLSLIALYKAIFLDKKSYWLLAGLLMGLAFDSKYTGVFLPLGLTLFLLISVTYRKHLFSVWYWLSALIFIITISPVIIWNVQNKFASFRFQTTGRVGEIGGLHINFENFFGVVGHQSAILIPILFFGLAFFVFKSVKKNGFRIAVIPPTTVFLLCFFLPLVTLFIAISFFYWVKLNWMMPAYITGIIWVSSFFPVKWIRYQVLVSLVIHLALAFEIIFYPFQVKSDDTWYGWEDLAKEVKNIQTKHPGAFVFASDGYKTSAVLDFYLDEKVYHPNVIGEEALQMDFMPNDLPALAGKQAIFLDSSPRFKDENKAGSYPPKLNAYFSSVEELNPILIKCRGKSVRKFFVYICKNYQPAAR